jgi:hypothetical protein
MAIRAKSVRKPKREVCWDGRYYKVRSDKIEIPNLAAMETFSALRWLITFTYPTGYSRPNPLAGMGGAISVGAR